MQKYEIEKISPLTGKVNVMEKGSFLFLELLMKIGNNYTLTLTLFNYEKK